MISNATASARLPSSPVTGTFASPRTAATKLASSSASGSPSSPCSGTRSIRLSRPRGNGEADALPEPAAAAADWDPRVYAAVALHPTRAHTLDDAARAELATLAAHPRVVAVGETGIDMYWPGRLDGCATPDQQREAFAWHIDLAKRTGKPLMIHNRDGDAEVLDVLAAEGAPETVIFHCFSSDAQMARTCARNGWLMSLSGTVSFRNAHALREAATVIPDELLLVETDAPFLTPHPYRGAPNESYCLPYTVRALADILDRPATEVARATFENAVRTYGFGTLTSWRG